MAVTATHLATATDTTNASPWLTASITPTAGRLILAYVGITSTATAASTPTLSGCGVTWVLVATTGTNVVHENALFRAMGTPTAGQVTITSIATAPTRCNWTIAEFDGVDTSGTNGSGAIVQSITSRPLAVTSVSVAFSAGITAGNGSFGGVDLNIGDTLTAGTGWTALGQATVATPVGAILGMAGTSGVGVSPIAASWTNSSNAWVIGAEIKAATSPELVMAPYRT